MNCYECRSPLLVILAEHRMSAYVTKLDSLDSKHYEQLGLKCRTPWSAVSLLYSLIHESLLLSHNQTTMYPAAGLAVVGATIIYIVIYRLYLHPLASVPGPWLARITKWWLVLQVRQERCTVFMPQLHKQYGRVVRIAPDQVLVCSEDAVKSAYSAGTDFVKGDWYQACAAPDKERRIRDDEHLDLLTETRTDVYRMQRRAIGPAYSIAGLEKHEHHLDTYIDRYVDKLRALNGSRLILRGGYTSTLLTPWAPSWSLSTLTTLVKVTMAEIWL